MTYTHLSQDTIAAISTATGGGVGIIRLSGKDAGRLGQSLFSSPFLDAPRVLVHGELRDPDNEGAFLDEGLAVYFPKPRSFTGEDVVELQLHGGHLHMLRSLEVVLRAGARLAEPGEFSKRAFLNGQMDLTRAEAIADLIAAQTDRALKEARSHLKGVLYDKLVSLRDRVLDLRAKLEVNLDFVDEDVPIFAIEDLAKEARQLAEELLTLGKSWHSAKHLQSTATVVLAGPPNAGKSTLFNVLCENERAIVTPIAGTTRDTLREPIDILGFPVLMVDTAGLHEGKSEHAQDEIEKIGMKRTYEAMEEADLVLYLVPPGEEAPEDLDERSLVVYSKADLRSETPRHRDLPKEGGRSVLVSSQSEEGLEALKEAIVAHLGGLPSEDLVISRQRQHELLMAAGHAMKAAEEGLALGLSPELPAVDLQETMDRLDALVGKSTLEDVLDRLFSTFCVGK